MLQAHLKPDAKAAALARFQDDPNCSEFDVALAHKPESRACVIRPAVRRDLSTVQRPW